MIWGLSIIFPDLSITDIASILEAKDSTFSTSPLHLAALELEKASKDVAELRLNLRHLKRLVRLGFTHDYKGLYRVLEDTLMVRFLFEPAKVNFAQVVRAAGIVDQTNTCDSGNKAEESLPSISTQIEHN